MRVTGVVAVAVLLLLSGCTSAKAPVVPSGSASPVAASCPSGDQLDPAGADNRSLARLPAGFSADAVVTCSLEQRRIGDGSVWSVVVEKRATSGVGALVAALKLPDEPIPTNQACPAVLVITPWFALVDSQGRWFRAHIPTDSCQQPRLAVLNLLQSLSWTEVSSTPYQQVQSSAEASLAAVAAGVGCPDQFKDVIAIEASTTGFSPRPWSGTSAAAGAYSICRFTAASDSSGATVLQFASGRRVTGSEAAALTSALRTLKPVVACSQQHQAVIGVFTTGGAWTLVEADGCHRVLDGNAEGWGQASPTLLALLR